MRGEADMKGEEGMPGEVARSSKVATEGPYRTVNAILPEKDAELCATELGQEMKKAM